MGRQISSVTPSHALTERNAGHAATMGSSAAMVSRGAVPSSWQFSHSREPSDCPSSIHGGTCILASLASIGRCAEHSSNDGYAYFLDRGNGQLTRLIPADMLPPLNEIPAREAETRGMVVLPPLRAGPPTGTIEMNYPVTVKKHIDRLISTSPSASKKIKIYCDKWIHEGVCAFTQQGCKYKHEMPFDEATQHSLGLFQGFPGWWKKRQEDMKRLSAGSDIGINISAGKGQIWKNGQVGNASGGASPPTKPKDAGPHDSAKAQVAPFIWGPIGPPGKTLASSGSWGAGTVSVSKGFDHIASSMRFATSAVVGRRAD